MSFLRQRQSHVSLFPFSHDGRAVLEILLRQRPFDIRDALVVQGEAVLLDKPLAFAL